MVNFRFDQNEIQFQYTEQPIERKLLEKLLYDIMDDLWLKTESKDHLCDEDKKQLLEKIRKKMME